MPVFKVPVHVYSPSTPTVGVYSVASSRLHPPAVAEPIIYKAGAATDASRLLLASCSDTIEMRRPPVYELPELPVVEDIHTYKAPLYWSIYEYCYTQEQAGVSNSDMDFTPEQWDEVIERKHPLSTLCNPRMTDDRTAR